jgi:UDP-3-O-acyl-N-acetylglucosamine deacetylase
VAKIEKITTDPATIADLKAARASHIFMPPTTWHDDSLELDPKKDYTLKQSAQISGIATFGKKPVDITISSVAREEASSRYGNDHNIMTKAHIDATRKGLRSITIGDVGICEHTMAMGPALGFYANYHLKGADNFPSFSHCTADIIEHLKNNLVEIGLSDFFTVKEAVAIIFDNGGYWIVEPRCDYKLEVDIQVDHPKNTIGTQRLTAEVTPELFTFIAQARTNVYKSLQVRIMDIMHSYSFSPGYTPYLGFDLDNVILVAKDSILNPRTEFDVDGTNREFIAHEVIDAIAPFDLLRGKPSLTLTKRWTNHAMEIEVIRALLNGKFLRRI